MTVSLLPNIRTSQKTASCWWRLRFVCITSKLPLFLYQQDRVEISPQVWLGILIYSDIKIDKEVDNPLVNENSTFHRLVKRVCNCNSFEKSIKRNVNKASVTVTFTSLNNSINTASVPSSMPIWATTEATRLKEYCLIYSCSGQDILTERKATAFQWVSS